MPLPFPPPPPERHDDQAEGGEEDELGLLLGEEVLAGGRELPGAGPDVADDVEPVTDGAGAEEDAREGIEAQGRALAQAIGELGREPAQEPLPTARWRGLTRPRKAAAATSRVAQRRRGGVA